MEACSQTDLTSQGPSICRFLMRFRGGEPGRRREAGGGEPLLGEDLVRREDHRLRPRAGVGDLQGVEKGGDDVDEAPLAGERLHEIEDNRGLESGERPRGRFEVQGNGNGDGLMAQRGKTPGDEIDLREDILSRPGPRLRPPLRG